MEWLRDPIWQFVGAIIGIVAIIVTYIVFKRQEKVKSIVYEIISNTPLLSVESGINNKLQISYDQKAIDNLNLLILRVQNSGNEPVLPTDYEKPITVEFEKATVILEAESVDVFPKDLKPNIKINRNKISLFPILLNEKDYVTLKILLTNFNGGVTVTGRAAGIRQVLPVGVGSLFYRRTFFGDLVAITFSASLIFPIMFLAIYTFSIKVYIAGIFFLLIFLFLLWKTIDLIVSTNRKLLFRK